MDQHPEHNLLVFFLIIVSISAGSATTYAYLSEFHSNTHRGRAIVLSSIVYGIACILLPLMAWCILGHEWQFEVPLIGVIYKPWRLYILICSLFGLLSFLILTFLPESPKFILGQGNQAKAYQILQKMNRINNGKNSLLEHFVICDEPETIEKRQQILNGEKKQFPFLSSVWNQTAPLFKSPYLFQTLLICVIQFLIFTTTNGFFM